MTNPDEIITAITQAPTTTAALEIMGTVRSRAAVLAVADQLYVDDPEGHTTAWLRRAIVKEARA